VSESLGNPPGAPETPSRDATKENVRRASDAVLAKHNVGKRGPGRPPTPGSPYSQAGKTGRVSPTPQNQAAVPLPPPIDTAVIKQGVESLAKVVDGILCRKIYRITLKLSADKKLAEEFAAETGLTKDEADLIAGLAASLCEKYQLAGQYAPEILLTVTMAGYGWRQYSTFRKLEELAQNQAAARRKEPDGSAPESLPSTTGN
jgi:hypothetical protein